MKSKYIIIVTIIIFSASIASALTDNSSWHNKVTVTYPSGARPYQATMNLSNSSGTSNGTHFFCGGNCNYNFSDLFFVRDDGTNLSYYIRNGTPSMLYLNLTDNSTITLYFNHTQNIGYSNGTNTFAFFDDYNRTDGAVDNGWTVINGAWVIEGNQIKGTNDVGAVSGIYKPYSGTNSIAVIGKAKANTDDRAYINIKATNAGDAAAGGLALRLSYFDSLIYFMDNDVDIGNTAFVFSNNVYYNYEWYINSDYSMSVYVWANTGTRPITPTLTKAAFAPVAAGTNFRFNNRRFAGNALYQDDTYVRTYIKPEGTWTWSSFSADNVPYPVSPGDGTTVLFTYPPIVSSVNFSWNVPYNTTSDLYELLISKDSNFNIIAVDDVVSTTYSIESLSGTQMYWWKVRTYNSTTGAYGQWSTAYSFTLLETSIGVNATGVQGVVYELINGVETPISGATVYVYNNSNMQSMVTGSNGYFLLTGLANGTYTLTSTFSDEYDDSFLIPITLKDSVLTKNILMQRCTTIYKCGLNKVFVTFAVMNLAMHRYPNVDVKVYKESENIPIFTGITGTSGEVLFYLSKKVRYTVTFTNSSLGISMTWTGTPTQTGFQYIIVPMTQTGTFINNTNELGTISVSVSTNITNASTAKIYANYTDVLNQTSGLTFYLNQSIPGDPNNQTNLQIVNGGSNGTYNASFTVSPYSGQGYIINVVAGHQTLGSLSKSYAVQFPSTTPLSYFNKTSVLMLIVALILFFAGFWGQTSTEAGALVICGLVWLLGGMGILANINLGVNFYLGLTLATVISILMNINARARKEGLS